MSEEQMREMCMRLAAEIVNRLRYSNETWEAHHGVPHAFTDSDYAAATEEVFEALFARTVWA